VAESDAEACSTMHAGVGVAIGQRAGRLQEHDSVAAQGKPEPPDSNALLPLPALFRSQISSPNFTMQKEDFHHIKIPAHV
jgi:hypothetical protein